MITAINTNVPSFGAKYTQVATGQLQEQIKNKLPFGEVTSVLKDKKGVLVQQQDGRAKMIFRFVDGILRERTEFLDGNKYKEVYSETGELAKKIQTIGGLKVVSEIRNGKPYRALNKIV